MVVRVSGDGSIMDVQRVSRDIVNSNLITLTFSSDLMTATHMSLALVLGLMCLSRLLFCSVMSVPIRSASASAPSIPPAVISLFLRRSLALMSGVMYSGSREVIVIVRSGQYLLRSPRAVA